MSRITIFRRSVLGAALLATVSVAIAQGNYMLGGADDSQSRFGGDGYAYFHEDQPAGNKALPPFRVTNPNGLPESAYAAASSEDPEWQPVTPINRGTPAADPIAPVDSKAGEIARFRAMDRFLESASDH